MKFSIVIPAYNGEKYIHETLKSACYQQRPVDEIIVYDDGSTDRTYEICTTYEFRKLVRIYRNKGGPSGFVNAWNAALQKASGDYITILHQDDLLDLRYMKTVEDALNHYPHVKHIYSACNYIDKLGNIKRLAVDDLSTGPHLYMGREYSKNYLRAAAVNKHIHRCPGVTTHKEIFSICKYREEAGHIADDDFFYRVGKYTDVIGISTPLASYRDHDESETGHLTKMQLTERLATAYVYQTQYHASYKYFDPEDVKVLNKLAVGHIISLLRHGLMFKDNSYIDKAHMYANKIKFVHLTDIYDYLPVRYKLLWFINTKFKWYKLDLHMGKILRIYSSIFRH